MNKAAFKKALIITVIAYFVRLIVGIIMNLIFKHGVEMTEILSSATTFALGAFTGSYSVAYWYEEKNGKKIPKHLREAQELYDWSRGNND